jgi:coenzyme F420 hydrogenase subunit beta
MLNNVQDNLAEVIKHSWCVGCGACTAVDPDLKLELDPVKLMYEPSGPSGPEAAKVCPAINVDYALLQSTIFPDLQVTEYGVVDSVILAQSTNIARNLNASSGGIVKEILRHALENGLVDAVIALKHVNGLKFSPSRLTAVEEIDVLPGSIYHNLDQSKVFQILKKHPGRYALVAIPCQLEGIFKYIADFEPELFDRVKLTVGLLCGWQYSHHAIEAMGFFERFDTQRIVNIAYRGGGPVGKLRFFLDDGKMRSVSRRINFSYQVAFDRHFNIPRCHLCINHSNFLADIVVGDAWLPSTVMTQTGISLLIIRRPSMKKLIDELTDNHMIVKADVTAEEIRESQTDRVIFGNFAYAYADFLEKQRIPHPNLLGPNRRRAKMVSQQEVLHFHNELHIKLNLQRNRRYRQLWWRKATIEAPHLLKRYLTWFAVRILRLKSLTGKRQEVSKFQLKGFR